MRNDSCRKRTVTTVTVTEMGMKSTKQLYCKKKGSIHPFVEVYRPLKQQQNVGLITVFSDVQLFFFRSGREETIIQDHHICLCRSQ